MDLSLRFQAELYNRLPSAGVLTKPTPVACSRGLARLKSHAPPEIPLSENAVIKTYLVGYPIHKPQTGTPFDVSVSNLVGGTTMTRRRTIAFGLSGIFLLWLLMTRRAEEGMFFIFGDAMDWRSRSLAGRHAINCGTVRTHSDPAAATSLALKAQSQGRPFRVPYNIIGIDSDVAAGLVRTPDGHLYGIGFTGNIFGQGGTSLRLQRVGQKPCPEPLHLYVNARGRLNCFEQQPSRNTMDENAEPY